MYHLPPSHVSTLVYYADAHGIDYRNFFALDIDKNDPAPLTPTAAARKLYLMQFTATYDDPAKAEQFTYCPVTTRQFTRMEILKALDEYKREVHDADPEDWNLSFVDYFTYELECYLTHTNDYENAPYVLA